GKAEWTYIVVPTTKGAPSWPRSAPVENVQATFNFLTLSAVIWLRLLYPVAASVFRCITPWPRSCWRLRRSSFPLAARGGRGNTSNTADHIVRCMTTPPSLSGLTTDTSRDTGPCLGTPPLSASSGWACIATSAHAGTSFPTWGRRCSLRAAVATLPCVDLSIY